MWLMPRNSPPKRLLITAEVTGRDGSYHENDGNQQKSNTRLGKKRMKGNNKIGPDSWRTDENK